MEIEYVISSLLGAIFGGCLVAFLWMLSPDFADAERYRWLKATTNTVTHSDGQRIDVRNDPELWDKAIDAARAQEAKQGEQANG
jgi:glycerol uptake facilitator-like aquaporin